MSSSIRSAGSPWPPISMCLQPRGTVVNFGLSGGAEATIPHLYPFFRNERRLVGAWMGSMAELQFGLDLVKQGKIRSALHKTLPLGQAREAHRMMAAAEVVGNWRCCHGRHEEGTSNVVARPPPASACSALSIRSSRRRWRVHPHAALAAAVSKPAASAASAEPTPARRTARRHPRNSRQDRQALHHQSLYSSGPSLMPDCRARKPL